MSAPTSDVTITKVGSVYQILWTQVGGNTPASHFHVQTAFLTDRSKFTPQMWQPVDRGADGKNIDPNVGVPIARVYPNGVTVNDARRPASWPNQMGWRLGGATGFIKARVAGEVDGSGLALVWAETPWTEVTGEDEAPVLAVEPFLPGDTSGAGGALPPPFGTLDPQ